LLSTPRPGQDPLVLSSAITVRQTDPRVAREFARFSCRLFFEVIDASFGRLSSQALFAPKLRYGVYQTPVVAVSDALIGSLASPALVCSTDARLEFVILPALFQARWICVPGSP